MRFLPISVWLSATLDMVESHKIGTQSACPRQLTMISCSLLLPRSIALVSPGTKPARDMPVFLLNEPGYVLGTNRKRITREQEGRRVYLQRRLLTNQKYFFSTGNFGFLFRLYR